ncbi:hypothetical protein FA15DRAFT_631309 [Coprinopsis marcescibilis]|uniref:ABM domain-containing protein n=1 Tax=Coprinopsis marcescibilis TaxID=230819 RepID=A0A5C3LBP5_COPMA|nr:hypothetical protein FA15DRAFT_631309 [Coprinopsis marcescibilis]
MPITELAILRLNQPYHSDPLPSLLELVVARQSLWPKFAVIYLCDPRDDKTLYILAGWDSVKVHEEWIQSEGNQELLTLFKPYMVEVSLRHFDIDFNRIPLDDHNCTAIGWQSTKAEEAVSELLLQSLDGVIWKGRGVEIEDNLRMHELLVFGIPSFADLPQAEPNLAQESANLLVLKRLPGSFAKFPQ